MSDVDPPLQPETFIPRAFAIGVVACVLAAVLGATVVGPMLFRWMVAAR